MIPGRFERQVARHGARPAVTVDGESVSYSELNRRANCLAHALLRELGPGREPVAVVTGEMVHATAAILGVLKSGKLCVPLDVATPAPRLAAVVEHAGAAAVLGSRAILPLAREVAGQRRPVLAADEPDGCEPDSNPDLAIGGQDLACVLYTSGSTGSPKGVVHDHLNLLAAVDHWSRRFGFGPQDRFVHLSPLSHVSAINDLLKPLLNGGCLVPLRLGESSLGRLAALVVEERITIYHSIPSVFRSMLAALDPQADLSFVRLVHLGGEPLFRTDVELFRARFPRTAVLVNNLGSTEVPTYVQYVIGPETPLDSAVVPIGFPVEGKRIRLVDERGAEVSDGEVGEIVVESAFVARGYWKDERATSERFRGSLERRAERTFRTGDLGRRRPDGAIAFVGRADDQIKVRGHRVELAEVQFAVAEAAREVGGVLDTTVVAGPSASGATGLVGYVVPRDRNNVPLARLRQLLAARLPAPMRPEAWVVLDALPRTSTGKIDRLALPPPARPSGAPGGPTPRRSRSTRQLAELWAQLLALETVPAGADFFELGGDSLLALELVSAVEKLFGRTLSLPEFAAAPTLAAMARLIEARPALRPAPCLVALDPNGSKDPLFLVHGLGGNVVQMRLLARRLDRDRPLWAFQSRGVDGVSLPLRTVEEMAQAYLDELLRLRPAGPYLLGGYSMGGVVAYEMARRLAAAGQEIRCLVLIDSGAPLPLPWSERLFSWLLYGRLLVRGMRARRGARERHGPYARRLNRLLVTNFRAARRYRPAPFRGPTHLIASRGSAESPAAERGFGRFERFERQLCRRRSLWSQLLPDGIAVHEIPGHHLDLFREPAVDDLSAELRSILDAASRAARPPLEALARSPSAQEV